MPQAGHYIALPSCKGAGSFIVSLQKREEQRFAQPVHWCQLCCWMPRTTCYSTTLFLGTLPTTKWCSLYHLIYLQISPLISLDRPHETPLSFTDGVGNGVTSLWHTVRLVLLGSSTSSLLMYFCTPPHGSTWIFGFQPFCFHPLSSFPPSYSLTPHDLTYLMELSTQLFILSPVLSLTKYFRIVTFFERLPSCRAFCCHYFEPLLE